MAIENVQQAFNRAIREKQLPDVMLLATVAQWQERLLCNIFLCRKCSIW